MYTYSRTIYKSAGCVSTTYYVSEHYYTLEFTVISINYLAYCCKSSWSANRGTVSVAG